jgi:hypothetical protein
VAAELRKEHGVEVELVEGGKGEFSVHVDGHLVAQKGATAPTDEEVLAAVRNAGAAAAK